jgi:hypothetical protein
MTKLFFAHVVIGNTKTIEMKKLYLLLATAFWGFLMLSSCAYNTDLAQPDASDFIVEYEFENGYQGWRGDFCDYNVNVPMQMLNFRYEIAALPSGTFPQKNALKISFDNINGDVFAYATAAYEMLRPDRLYEVNYQVELASKYPSGGAGDIIFVKAGATNVQPQKVLYGDYVGINVLKGNHGLEGEQLSVIGTAGVPLNNNLYQPVVLRSRRPVYVQSNRFGQLWFTVGFDSVYSGSTELYVSKIRVFLRLVR